MIKICLINKEERRLRSFWRIISQLCITFLMMFIIFRGLGYLISFLKWHDIIINNDMYFGVYFNFIVFLAMIISMIITSKYIDKRDISDFGIKINILLIIDFIWGFLIGGITIIFIYLTELSLNWISINRILALDSKALFFLLRTIFVATYEELFYRGYLLINLSEGLYFKKYISKKSSIILSVILTSTIFSLAHWQRILLEDNIKELAIVSTNYFIFGVLLSLVFIYTKKMAIPIGFHIAYNFFRYLVDYIDFEVINYFYLFGFSPERVLTFFALIVAGILLYLLIKIRHKQVKLKVNLF